MASFFKIKKGAESASMSSSSPINEGPLHVGRTRTTFKERAQEIIKDMGKYAVIRICEFTASFRCLTNLKIGNDTPLLLSGCCYRELDLGQNQ